MRKIIILIMSLFVLTSTFAKEYPFEEVLFIEDPGAFYIFEEGLFKAIYISLDYEVTEKKYTYTLKKENAYLIADLKSDEENNKLYIFSSDAKHLLMYDYNQKKTIICTRRGTHTTEPWIWSGFHYKATSHLTEVLNGKEVIYKAENLSTWDLTKSWVEGVEGFGIGESVSFLNVGDGSRRIYIINGFFSPEKPSLFYDNARVKRLLIHCFDRDENLVNVEERELNDTGEMQVLEFSKRYDSFQFIIKEVYPGRKYEDTAITGIFCDALDLYE